MKQRSHARRQLHVFVWLAVVSVLAPLASASASRGQAFRQSGFAGTGVATMQAVSAPARMGRVAVDPVTHQVWAIGFTRSIRTDVAGWDRTSPSGQLVFLRYTSSAGWQIAGAPVNTSGVAINPLLFSFALVGDEGWAVGSNGVMLYKAPRSSAWMNNASAEAVAAGAQLRAISLVRSGGSVVGYAAGPGPTVLRYVDGTWSKDQTTGIAGDLGSVAAVSRDEAWATSVPTATDVALYHRVSGSWSPVALDPIFQGPHPTAAKNNGVVDSASASSIAADENGAWVGGSMVTRDAAHLFGDPTPGDTSRPFIVRVPANGSMTSYCPDQYGVRRQSQATTLDTRAFCDEPMPLTALDITSIQQISSHEVFAGGLGLFHFKNNGWVREPDSIGYIRSLAFIGANEGWLTTTGNTFGSAGAAGSSETLVGHWTNHPEASRIARWPQPQRAPLHAIAFSPDATRRAMAVGEDGAVVMYVPEVGWDYQIRVTENAVHAIAWPAVNEAWAVGEHGMIQKFDGSRWHADGASEVLSTKSLFGITFLAPNDGYAVGAQGTVLHFDGATWTRDAAASALTNETLYGIATTQDGRLFAVGANSTVLIRDTRGWRADASAVKLLKRGTSTPPDLYAVVVTDDDRVIVGGAKSALAVWSPGGFEPFSRGIEGTVIDMAARGSSVYAIISPDERKWSGDRMAATRTSLLGLDSTGWRDLSFSRKRAIFVATDSSQYGDPMYAIALEPGGRRGWAVGGFPASTPDSDNHFRLLATSSVYRVDHDDDPTPPHSVADVHLPQTGFNFAFFAESWCGAGVCGAQIGSDTQADSVALQIQREIRQATHLPSGPGFVMFGGNTRGLGIPEELSQGLAFLRSFDVPVYGALGDRDLFSGLSASAVSSVPAAGSQTAGVSDYWKEVFAAAPGPWGAGRMRSGFEPVALSTDAVPTGSLARTHYAFDYQPDGKKLARIIVIDSSTRSYGNADGSDQNPPERQDNWLQFVLLDAKLQNGGRGVPTIIVMNQPTILPDSTPQPNWRNPNDTFNFAGVVVANGVSAVITGGPRENIRDGYPNTDSAIVPVFTSGGGGAPLGYDKPSQTTSAPSKLPTDGYYNAWYIVSVGAPAGALGQAPVKVTSFPVLDSVAMHAINGRDQSAGNLLRFSALARGLSGGDSDPEQSKATYFDIGSSALVNCGTHGQGFATCASRDAINPPYRFYSEDPSIADFVLPDPQVGDTLPARDKQTNRIMHDPSGHFGLLCTFKPGKVYINVESGWQRARTQVTVHGGSGPCIDKPVIEKHVVNPIPPKKQVVHVPEHFSVHHFRPVANQVVVVIPPPPAPVLAPAPPGAPGVGRKEEHEVQPDTEGQGPTGGHHFVSARESGFDAASSPWPLLGGMMFLSFVGAVIVAAARRRLPDPARATRSRF
ncbi:MAG: WD40/YVTN/BNR-like repeat-containing protein [Actinomycetota bacterium]|nr:hypothetical protein [Actinomycetota bacterium]